MTRAPEADKTGVLECENLSGEHLGLMRKRWTKAAAVALAVFGGYFVLEALLTGGDLPLGALGALVLGVLGCVLVVRERGLGAAETEVLEQRDAQGGRARPALRVIKGGKDA